MPISNADQCSILCTEIFEWHRVTTIIPGDIISQQYKHTVRLLKTWQTSTIPVPVTCIMESNLVNCRQALRFRHNECDCVSNYRRLDCLLNRFFRRKSTKTSNLCVTGLCEGIPAVTGRFPSQRVNNALNDSIWWRHYGYWKKQSSRQAISDLNTDVCISWSLFQLWYRFEGFLAFL